VQDDPTSPDDAEFGFMDEFDDDQHAASERDPRAWRMAALAAATCLAAVAVAIVLLRLGGGGGTQRDVSLPIVTGGPSSPALISPPVATPDQRSSIPAIKRLHTSARPTRARTTAARTTSTHPRPGSTPPSTTARTSTATPPPTSQPPSTPAAPQPGVLLAKGGRDFRCHSQCYFLAVTLTNLPGGHRIVCEAESPQHQRVRVFGSYDYDSTQTPGCSYSRTGDLVWVVVDNRYRSNTVTW
jgi:hypothetical protein